jgi:ribosomal protein S12 methylthiotransferase accessory factor
MRFIVFLGPSLPLDEARSILDADFRPPCRRGDLEGLASGSIVGLIDGVFHQTEAISPREIVDALRCGVRIFGGSSIGALRAAEVPDVHGVGRVYEMYRDGVIDSDDEVAVAFDPETLLPVTVPLVNVRFALDRLTRSGTVTAETASSILSAAAGLHYTQRTYRVILRACGLLDRLDGEALLGLLNHSDLKADDARLLLEQLAATAAEHRQTDSGAVVGEESVRDGNQPRNRNEMQPVPAHSVGRAVHIWEGGDTLPFPALVLFLKLTGCFDGYAANAVLRLLGREHCEPAENETLQAQRLFQQLCASWGWRTDEEVRVTMRDLGLLADTVTRELSLEIARAARIGELVRTSDERLLEALRHELFVNDLALKRETMRCASLRALADSCPASARGTSDRARVLADLDMDGSKSSVRRRFAEFGVTDDEINQFIVTVSRARDHVSLLCAPAAAPVAAWLNGDRQFGLASAVKAGSELRFSVPIDEALGRALELSRTVGITRIGMIERLSELQGVFVSQVARPAGAWSSSYGSGKSDSKDGAVIGGIMEETEKWAQEQFEGNPTWASCDEMRDEANALDPRQLDLPYDSSYASNATIPWHECFDLVQAATIWVPLATLTPSAGRNNIYFSRRAARVVFSTNGLASAFTLTEAVVHATCEYIERHAARMMELRVENPGLCSLETWPRKIDEESLSDATRTVIEMLRRGGNGAGLWDVTSEIQVPTLLARVAWEGSISVGYATHPNPAVAAHMAILEACQSIAGNIAASREDLTVQARSLGRHERSRPTRQLAEAFWNNDGQPAVRLSDLDGLVATDCYEEFVWIRQRLVRGGASHLVVVNLSRDAIQPASVVRVVIPGLETNNPFHIGPRARAALLPDLVRSRGTRALDTLAAADTGPGG